MSLASTRTNFESLLADSEAKVIALVGRWGTGKSRLWSDVESTLKGQSATVRASLFGVADMRALKLRLLHASVQSSEKWATFETIGKAAEGVRKAAEGFHKAFGAVDDAALLFLPARLKGKIVVLDDVERKSSKLPIDEILGFIDELTQLDGTRILMILNDDQLLDKAEWQKVREKVVDQELRLDTTPREAFDIAMNGRSEAFGPQLAESVQRARLSNIRVIRKIIRTAERLLNGRGELSPEVFDRVLPSIALLAAVHFRGIDDAPEVSFLVDYNSPANADKEFDSAFKKKLEGREATEEDKALEAKSARRSALMERMRIPACDEFELQVAAYLESGSFDAHAVAKCIDRYSSDHNVLDAQAQLRRFMEACVWEIESDDATLVARARSFVAIAPHLDAYAVTTLHGVVAGLEGGAEVAEAIVEAWLQAFRSKPFSEWPDDLPLRRPVHPAISQEIQSRERQAAVDVSLVRACRSFITTGLEGSAEVLRLNTATVGEYIAAIETARGDDLRDLLRTCIELASTRGPADMKFGSAVDAFVDACRYLRATNSNPRLTRLLNIIFEDAKLAMLLDGDDPAAR